MAIIRMPIMAQLRTGRLVSGIRWNNPPGLTAVPIRHSRHAGPDANCLPPVACIASGQRQIRGRNALCHHATPLLAVLAGCGSAACSGRSRRTDRRTVFQPAGEQRAVDAGLRGCGPVLRDFRLCDGVHHPWQATRRRPFYRPLRLCTLHPHLSDLLVFHAAGAGGLHARAGHAEPRPCGPRDMALLHPVAHRGRTANSACRLDADARDLFLSRLHPFSHHAGALAARPARDLGRACDCRIALAGGSASHWHAHSKPAHNRVHSGRPGRHPDLLG